MPLELTCGERYGALRRRFATAAVDVSECSYEPGEGIPLHYHSSPQVCLVLAGWYDERYRGTTLPAETGTAFYHAPGEVHENRFGDNGGTCLHVDLDPAFFSDRLGQRLGSGLSRRTSATWRAFQLGLELRNPDDVSGIQVEELAVDLFEDVLRIPGLAASAPPAWLEGVRDRVHEEFRRPPSLAELAAGAGVHRVTVAQAFRAHFRCTVGQYIRQRRVEAAIRRLLEPDASLSSVAYHSGFADQAHLTRTFRRLTGTTPGAFRRRFARGIT